MTGFVESVKCFFFFFFSRASESSPETHIPLSVLLPGLYSAVCTNASKEGGAIVEVFSSDMSPSGSTTVQQTACGVVTTFCNLTQKYVNENKYICICCYSFMGLNGLNVQHFWKNGCLLSC